MPGSPAATLPDPAIPPSAPRRCPGSMAGLEEDILACLEELAPGNGSGGGGDSGGGGGGSSGADWPLAWLLLDLQQLLPPNSSLAQKLRSDVGQLAREMEAADGDAQLACRRAGTLLAAIAEDNFSTQQLAELLQKSDGMLALCRQALQQAASARQRTAAPDVLSRAVWQVLHTAAAKLDSAAHCARSGGAGGGATAQQLLEQWGEAAQGALRALQVATQLSSSVGSARWSLEQHGDSIAAVLQGAAGAASNYCLPAAAKDSLSRLLTWWAVQVPLLLCEHWRYPCHHRAALCITGKHARSVMWEAEHVRHTHARPAGLPGHETGSLA